MVLTNQSLQSYNTFGIDVSAKYFSEIKSTDDFKALITEPGFEKEEKLILGGGSNILFTKMWMDWLLRTPFPE